MKNCGIIVLMFFIAYQVKADIIYIPHTDIGTAVSIQGAIGVEKPFTKHNSVNFWGGFGAESIVNQMQNPALKGEVTIEIKHYFSASTFKGFNLGLYSGFAYLDAPTFYRDQYVRNKEYVGFVPGLRLSYLARVGPLFQLEPYIGVSTPMYENDVEELFEHFSDYSPGFILTLGFRAELNKLLH